MAVNRPDGGINNSQNQGFNKARGLVSKVNPAIGALHSLGTAGEKAVGGIIGGKKGGFAGQVLFNPIGAALSFSGDHERQRDVAAVDPAQAARLREIDRTRKQISSGTDALTQQRISEVKKSGETTKGQLAKFSGGDVGGTISSFLRAQRNTGKGINDAFQKGQARIPFFENLSTQLGNRISQRKLELGVHELDRSRAQEAQAQTTANLNESGRQASEGGTGGLGGVIDLVKGSGLISNKTGGGLGSLFGGQQGAESAGAGMLKAAGIGGGTGQAGGGGTFGQALGGASNGAAGGFGEGVKSAHGSVGGGAASSGGGGTAAGGLIKKGASLLGGLFG